MDAGYDKYRKAVIINGVVDAAIVKKLPFDSNKKRMTYVLDT